MSDLDQILELIASFFAAVVILLILLTWLETTMSRDYPRARRRWLRRLQPSKNEGQDRLLPTTGSDFHCGRGLIAVEHLQSDGGVAGLSNSRIPSPVPARSCPARRGRT